MNYQFANLLGAPYRGGSLLLHGNDLLSPVGNRVSQINLTHSTSHTLPFENLKQIQTLCLSTDGQLLLSIDEEGRALLIQRTRRVLLHHVSFKAPVRAAKFSPDGKYVAVAVGKLLQVWVTPSTEKQMSPMQLHRTYGGCHDTITALDWSPDGHFIAVASRDLTARIFSLNPIEGYTPPTLSGHRDRLVGVFFTSAATQEAAVVAGVAPVVLYTVSRDGALVGWTHTVANEPEQQQQQVHQKRYLHKQKQQQHKRKLSRQQQGGGDQDEEMDEPESSEVEEEEGGEQQQQPSPAPAQAVPAIARGTWGLGSKHFFMQRGAKLSAADFHKGTGVLVVGFSNGLFELYQLPEFQQIHALSVSRERISALAFNAAGDWLALGAAKLGQLLVWEWRSEAYVLKQQGHYFDVSCTAYSPDGSTIATGADDAKVKLFQMRSGFCYVTFSDHTAPVTGVRFLPSGHAVVSSSLDGTVRAYDLLRYRNFRTMTSPEPCQFGCLAVDPSGEVVCAGSVDNFQVYVWFLKTGRLLDVLPGHEGPVTALAFSPTDPILASSSWDKTVRLWDVYDGKGVLETLDHPHDVLALAFRPDGKQLASATLDGSIYFWQPQEGDLQGVIEGRRDVRGGRLVSDRRSAANLSSGAAFTSLVYSADGAQLFAAGNSKWVCVYDVEEGVLLRRFQISSNRSLDGVLDVLNSKHLTDAGPLQLIDHEGREAEEELLPPGGNPAAAAGVPGAAGKRPVVRTRALALSPTGQSWAAATTEGLLIHALDRGMLFDPTDLTESLTPAAFHAALAAKAYVRALLISLRLNDQGLLRHGLMSVPVSQVTTVAAALPAVVLEQVLESIVACMNDSPHLEFLLQWVRSLLVKHGEAVAAGAAGGSSSGGSGSGAAVMAVFRSLQQVLNRVHDDLKGAADENLYLLEYVLAAGTAKQRQQQQREAGVQEEDVS